VCPSASRPPNTLVSLFDCLELTFRPHPSPSLQANVSVRQNKKRKFYCAAQLDAVSIKKFGFRKFLRKKFRGSAGLKTAEKNLKVMRLLEAKASREEALEAAKYAITFLTLKVENCQAALDEATKQFQVDFPDEAADFIPKPKTDTKLLKKEVQAITSALKIKYKEKLDKMRQAAKEAKKQRKATAKAAAKAKTGRARRTTCAKCGQSDHVRSSKKLCPKYEPRPRKTKAKPAKGPKGATVEVVATAAAPAAKKPRRGKKSNVTL